MEIISIPPWEINWTYFSLQVHTLTCQTQIMEFYASYNYIHLSRIIYSSLWIDYRCDKFYGVNDMDVDNHLHRRKTFTLIRSTNSAGFHFCTLALFFTHWYRPVVTLLSWIYWQTYRYLMSCSDCNPQKINE